MFWGIASSAKHDKHFRSFNKEFAYHLADAIKVEGMLQPICVRPDPDKADCFIIVAGRHRFYAVKNVLKEQFIECNVLEIDAEQHEMLAISENLWRNPLTKNQHGLSIKRWYDLYALANPDKVGYAHGGYVRAAKAAEAATENAGETAGAATANLAGTTNGENSESVSADDAKTVETGAAEVLAAAMGTSKRTAERKIALARKFDEEQLEALDQMKVTQEEREEIARIADPVEMNKVILLIIAGMDVQPAIAEVLKDKAPVVSKVKEPAQAKAAATKAPNLTDDEWYASQCGEKGAMLADDTKFKADALLYRAIVDERAAFRAKIKGKVATTRQGKVLGPFYNQINRVLSVSHPKDWPLCGTCGGKTVVDEQKCPRRYGAG
jgi:hypothetical protein